MDKLPSLTFVAHLIVDQRKTEEPRSSGLKDYIKPRKGLTDVNQA